MSSAVDTLSWNRRLHLGAGDLHFPGWINLDLNEGIDLRRGLHAWPDESVDAIYSCHFLEHLNHRDGLRLLQESYRVLEPGGAIRIGVPDFRLFAQAYLREEDDFAEAYLDRYCPDEQEDSDRPERFFRQYGAAGALLAIVHGWGHKAIYDESILKAQLTLAGFEADDIHRCAFAQSHYFDRWELDRRYADHSLFMEACKRERHRGKQL